MKWLTKFLGSGFEATDRKATAEQTALPQTSRNEVQPEMYGLQCLLGARIERAIRGHGSPMIVPVEPLPLLSDIEQTGRAIRTVHLGNNESPEPLGVQRALACFTGDPLPLGHSDESIRRGMQPARAAGNRKRRAA